MHARPSLVSACAPDGTLRALAAYIEHAVRIHARNVRSLARNDAMRFSLRVEMHRLETHECRYVPAHANEGAHARTHADSYSRTHADSCEQELVAGDRGLTTRAQEGGGGRERERERESDGEWERESDGERVRKQESQIARANTETRARKRASERVSEQVSG
eukprot:6197909-Pleurochrysis_carterae.AAC.1